MEDGASVWPLVVDLDGTLIRTNSLDETLLDSLRRHPAVLWELPVVLLAGRARTKAWLAGHSGLDVETWPVRQDFLDYLRLQGEAGRLVVLATGADRAVAEAMAARFPFIREIIAVSGTGPGRSLAKAERLRERFPDGFAYAGNSSADLAIWRQAGATVIVDASPRVFREATRAATPAAVFPRLPFSPAILHKSLRLHQWAKNALVFVPLLLGGKADDPVAWLHGLLGFLALSFAASATYLINDLWDLPSDRRHWTKRLRPLACGDLSIRGALLLAITAWAIAFGLAACVGLPEVAMLTIYLVASLSYSFALKQVPILDVLVLAGLYTFRLGFGIVLVDVRLSPWLLVFSMFLFLSLSMVKRHTELQRWIALGFDRAPGRGYVATDAPVALGVGVGAMLAAILILILYLIEDAFPRGYYANSLWLWCLPPILFLFLGRIWLLSQRGELHDDPVAFALKDRPSLLLGGSMALCFGAAVIGVGQ